MTEENLPRPEGYEKYTFPFIVKKPWGKEVWLELWNDKKTGRGYCYKEIHLNEGEQTSHQYHQIKVETNYVLGGQAELWIQNDEGILVKKVLTEGDSFTVVPPKQHYIVALTNLILLEVSTPEVDDVIRLKDKFGRDSGKIDSEHK